MEGKLVSVVIEENGDLTFLDTDAERCFLELGTAVTRRASHVEPVSLTLRVAFYILRWFGDKNRIAQWTRNWNCEWRVNTSPVGGPVLCYKHVYPNVDWTGHESIGNTVKTWYDRQEAIDAEVAFLNEYFLERQ